MTTVAEYRFDDLEFNVMWDNQLLDYPTIGRNEAGDWRYFNVAPETAERIYENGVERTLDGVEDWEVQLTQGAELVRESLEIAAQAREADSVALDAALRAAIEIEPGHPARSVALGFIDEILQSAIRGRK